MRYQLVIFDFDGTLADSFPWAMRNLDQAAVRCVGDEIRDVEAARKEGVAFGAVAWGYTRLEALAAHAPEETFLAPADLLALAPPGLVSS